MSAAEPTLTVRASGRGPLGFFLLLLGVLMVVVPAWMLVVDVLLPPRDLDPVPYGTPITWTSQSTGVLTIYTTNDAADPPRCWVDDPRSGAVSSPATRSATVDGLQPTYSAPPPGPQGTITCANLRGRGEFAVHQELPEIQVRELLVVLGLGVVCIGAGAVLLALTRRQRQP